MTDENGATSEQGADEVMAEDQTTAQEDQSQADASEAGDSAELADEPKREEDKKRETSQQRKERQRAAREKTEAELRDAKARLERITKASQGVEPPEEKNFANPDEWIAAEAAWKSSEAFAKQQRALAELEVEEVQVHAAQQRQEAWNFQQEDARQKYSDYDARVSDPSLPISPDLAHILVASDMGAEVVYHLSGNHAEAFRISRMDPVSMAREVGRLEAVLSTPEPKTQTKAPAPPSTLQGSTPKVGYRSDMTPDEYRAFRASGGTP